MRIQNFLINAFTAILMIVWLSGCDKPRSDLKELSKDNIEVKKVPELKLVEPPETLITAAKRFQEKYPTSALAWNPYTGYVKQLSSFVSKPAENVRDPQSAADSFIRTYSGFFGPGKVYGNLQLKKISEARGQNTDSVTSRFVRFAQVMDRVPVYQGEIVVHLTAQNSVYAVYNSLHAITSREGQMKLSRDQALEKARSLLKDKPKSTTHEKINQIIYPFGNVGIRSWQVIIDHWLVILHGDTGETLLLKDRARYGPDALIYLENPVKTPDPAIRPITNLGTATTLCGARFCANNLSGETITSAVQEFRDPTSDVNFDDQMVYYHMETIANRFNNLGVTGPAGTLPVEILTNDASTGCNAYYNIDFDFFSFGPATSNCTGDCASAGHYADIIYHEFTHRLLDEEVGLNYDYTESGSIHEGTSDYFSASLLGNPCMGEEWFTGTPCLRDASQFLLYPRDMDNEPHAGGEVWASALWTLRSKVGDDLAERIVRQGLIGLPSDADFSTFAGNMVVQSAAYFTDLLGDNAWENFFILLALGVAVEGTKEAFCEHGIPVPYGSFADLSLRTPPEDTRSTWTLAIPSGYEIDSGRGCKGGYDILAPGGWEDVKYFNEHKSDLEEYSVDMSTSTFTVVMETPGGCGGGVDRVNLIYRVYYGLAD